MKKTGLLILFLMLCLFVTGCGNESDAPEGMQLVEGGENLGYYFYAPEEWTVANHNGISTAYASKIETSSATLTEAQMPKTSFEEYFTASFKGSKITPDVKLMAEACSFGNAEEAYKFIYDFKYENGNMRCMQILSVFEGKFYIFTFTSQLAERTEGESYYDFYLEKVQNIIKNVKFISQNKQNSASEYPTDSDGYSMITSSDVCDFKFFIPSCWNVRYTDAAVGVSTSDGASVNMSEVSAALVSFADYYERRKGEIEALFGTVTDINEGQINAPGASQAYFYEYSYDYNGVTYHVYQVILIAGFPAAGYVLTYTAPDSAYSAHLQEVKKMISKVSFD